MASEYLTALYLSHADVYQRADMDGLFLNVAIRPSPIPVFYVFYLWNCVVYCPPVWLFICVLNDQSAILLFVTIKLLFFLLYYVFVLNLYYIWYHILFHLLFHLLYYLLHLFLY